MRDLRLEFLRRAREHGVPVEGADEVFSWMEGFSVYGFSAAHAASFAELSYASAYMRCHYPAEFFAALLDSQPMGFYSPRLLLNEARSDRAERAPAGHPPLRRGLHRRGGRDGSPRGPPLLQGSLGEVYFVRRLRAAQEAVRLGRGPLPEDGRRERLAGEPRQGRVPRLSGRRVRTVAVARRGKDVTEEEETRLHWAAGDPAATPGELVGIEERRSVEHLPLADTARERMEWEVLGLNISRHPLSPYRAALGKPGSFRARGSGASQWDQDPRGRLARVFTEPPDKERSPRLLPVGRGRAGAVAGDHLPLRVREARTRPAPGRRVLARRQSGANHGGAERRIRFPGA